MSTINVMTPSLTIDVSDDSPIVNVLSDSLVLDIESGGIVPAAIDTILEAGESISALRCITTNDLGKAKYATPDSIANAMVIGISTNSASIGENVTIKTSGQMTDGNWSFTKGPIFLGSNGTLTQTAPSGGLIVAQIGRAITSTTIVIDIDFTITTA